MFPVLTLLLPFDIMLQHNLCKRFFLLLPPYGPFGHRASLAGNALIGKCLFQRRTGGQASFTSGGKGNEGDLQMGVASSMCICAENTWRFEFRS